MEDEANKEKKRESGPLRTFSIQGCVKLQSLFTSIYERSTHKQEKWEGHTYHVSKMVGSPHEDYNKNKGRQSVNSSYHSAVLKFEDNRVKRRAQFAFEALQLIQINVLKGYPHLVTFSSEEAKPYIILTYENVHIVLIILNLYSIGTICVTGLLGFIRIISPSKYKLWGIY